MTDIRFFDSDLLSLTHIVVRGLKNGLAYGLTPRIGSADGCLGDVVIDGAARRVAIVEAVVKCIETKRLAVGVAHDITAKGEVIVRQTQLPENDSR